MTGEGGTTIKSLLDDKIGIGQSALIVDDEKSIGFALAGLLEQLGYEVDYAADGEAALEKTRERDYSAIVCDILMPGLNGMKLYDVWLQESPENVRKVIFVTGDSIGYETNAFLHRTGCRCIYKPFKLADLAEALMELTAATT